MIDTAYATFIEDCRDQRAALTGLIEALQGHRMNPGAPIAVPPELGPATDATLQAFQEARLALNRLIDAYDALPGDALADAPKSGA
jgi:hypothetical protein